MSVIEEISIMPNSDCDDDVLMNILECELNRDKHEEPRNHNYDFCKDCNLKMLTDNPAYVTSYNHLMKRVRRRCMYKRSDNFNTKSVLLWWKAACSR